MMDDFQWLHFQHLTCVCNPLLLKVTAVKIHRPVSSGLLLEISMAQVLSEVRKVSRVSVEHCRPFESVPPEHKMVGPADEPWFFSEMGSVCRQMHVKTLVSVLQLILKVAPSSTEFSSSISEGLVWQLFKEARFTRPASDKANKARKAPQANSFISC